CWAGGGVVRVFCGVAMGGGLWETVLCRRFGARFGDGDDGSPAHHGGDELRRSAKCGSRIGNQQRGGPGSGSPGDRALWNRDGKGLRCEPGTAPGKTWPAVGDNSTDSRERDSAP